MPEVNPARRYDSKRRRDQALRTRNAVIESATGLFLANGYAKTTIAAVAADADVSVETIYKAFGGKPGLVRAIRDHALEGEGPVAAEQRSDELQAHEPDPRAIIRGWGLLTAEVAPRTAPILLLVRDAAGTDPDMARLRQEMDNDRLVRMTHNARTLHDRGHLRDGVTLHDAAELMWTYTAPELFELLVLGRGWSSSRFGGFVADALVAALLPD
jgi:AcrR family transcriptional regulator